MEWSFDLADILISAEKCWLASEPHRVFAVHGDMGAGKTTFIHALCEAKGVSSPVGSPSYSIINQYEYPGGHIFHLDLYRLKDEEEAFRAGVEDVLYSGDICLVEWPERAPGLFPTDTIDLYIEATGPFTRTIRLKSDLNL